MEKADEKKEKEPMDVGGFGAHHKKSSNNYYFRCSICAKCPCRVNKVRYDNNLKIIIF
jgi:hypothetical protein